MNTKKILEASDISQIKIYGYTIEEIKDVINFAVSRGYNKNERTKKDETSICIKCGNREIGKEFISLEQNVYGAKKFLSGLITKI